MVALQKITSSVPVLHNKVLENTRFDTFVLEYSFDYEIGVMGTLFTLNQIHNI